MPFKRPWFKEFTLRVRGNVPALLSRLLSAGYHAGLHLGRWYPQWNECLTLAVTEKRTKTEIDGLASVWSTAETPAQNV